MDTPHAPETLLDLPQLTDAELAEVVGGNDTVMNAWAAVNRRVGCGCGVGHD